MLDLSSNVPKAKIIDFGYARPFHAPSHSFNKLGLNLNYVASECINGLLYSPQSDIFSVGVVMYQLLFGTPPWFRDISKFRSDSGKSEELIIESRSKPLRLSTKENEIIGHSEQVNLVLKKALCRDTEDRFKSADDFIRAIIGEIEVEDIDKVQKVRSDDKSEKKFKAKKTKGKGFDAIVGLDKLKEEMRRSVINKLEDPEKARRYGAKIPNGMILYGPPGCGKTFFAKHFAEEVGFNYIIATPSTLKSKYVNATQENIAMMFQEAEKEAPTIIFIDEINELLPHREGDSHEMSKSAMNEMLAQMDRTGERGIFVIGACNYPNMIDPAMLRAGRLEKKFYLPPPDFKTRKALFQKSLSERKSVLDFGIDYDKLADITENYVIADIELIVNESSSLAMNQDARISMKILESVIKEYRPFPKEELDKYERIKANMEGRNNLNNNNDRPQIGFNK